MAPKADKAKRQPSIRDLLKSAPHQNARIGVEPWGDDGALVSVPIRRPRWMVPPITWLLPFRPERRFELDVLGVSVLNMCDGKKTIEQIVGQFAQNNGLTLREAQVSVLQFLRMLTQRGVIAIVMGGGR